MRSDMKKYFRKGFPFFRSFRLRIFLIILCAGIIPATILRYVIVNAYENRAVDVKKKEVENQVRIIANHLLAYGYLEDSSSEVVNAELNQLSNLYNGRVMIMDDTFRVIRDTYGISEGKTMISEEVIKCYRGESHTHYNRRYQYIEMTVPITEFPVNRDTGETSDVSVCRGVMLVSASTDNIAITRAILNRKSMVVLFTCIGCMVAIAIGLSYILIRPFNKITQAITAVRAGFSDEEISVPDYYETVHIVDAFNQLQRRMKAFDDSRQEFVANVSHELKTPITSMKVLADSLLTQDNVPVEIYREFMEDISAEIDRENEIINDLLTLVKMDKTAADMSIQQTDINSLVEQIMKRLRPIAVQHEVELIFESLRAVSANVDSVKLTLAVSNLIENAIKYNHPGGWVRIVLDADHQVFTVTVQDSGIGIAKEDLEHIYERFYRVDKSHSKEIGGTGLGLAITRSAVLMHRGSIQVESALGEGTTFTMRIPLIYIV